MIGYLKGRIVELGDGDIVVAAIAGAGAVGYLVTVTAVTFQRLRIDMDVELYVHTHVREDALKLFGFASPMEKELFKVLINVNGVGPKVAMAVMGRASVQDLVQAVLDGNAGFLSSAPGVGKKTAERILMEATDAVQKRIESGALVVNPPVPGAAVGQLAELAALKREARTAMVDARSALVGLGYREQDVDSLMDKLVGRLGAGASAEDLVRAALQNLGNFL